MTEEEKRLSQNVPDALLYQPGRYDADVVMNRWYDHLENQWGPDCYQGRVIFVPDDGREPVFVTLAPQRYPCASSGGKTRAKAAAREWVESCERWRRNYGYRPEVQLEFRSRDRRRPAGFFEFGNMWRELDGDIYRL